MSSQSKSEKRPLLVERQGAVETFTINDAPRNRMGLDFMAVVLGFSKYTRMTTSKSSWCFSFSGIRRLAYSTAASVSWIEHGPAMTRTRSSSPASILWMASRVSRVVLVAASEMGSSFVISLGLITFLILAILRSSVLFVVTGFLVCKI